MTAAQSVECRASDAMLEHDDSSPEQLRAAGFAVAREQIRQTASAVRL